MLQRNLIRLYNRNFFVYFFYIKPAFNNCDKLNIKTSPSNIYMSGNCPYRSVKCTSFTEFPKRLASSASDEQNSAVDCEEELMDDFEQDVLENGNNKFSLKEILYTESEDKIIKKLNGCTNLHDLLRVYEDHVDQFTEKHATQLVILAWSWIRSNNTENIDIGASKFKHFRDKLRTFVHRMNLDEMTCNLLYLQKLGIDSSEKVMQELLCNILKSINQAHSDISLSALSRFAVAVDSNPELYSYLILKDICPHIYQRLRNCTEAEEFRLLTICMQHLNHLATQEMLNLYAHRAEHLLKEGKITSSDIRCILKVINFLNFPHLSQQNSHLIRSFLLLIKGEMLALSTKDLEVVFRVLQSQLEPASIIPHAQAAANALFKRCPSIESLNLATQFFEPQRRTEMMAAAKEIITNESLTSTKLPLVFKILRSLKISDVNLCDRYWSSVLKQIQEEPSEQEPHLMFRHCHRYMHFNNNLGGTYRHREFEKSLYTLLVHDIEHGLSGIVASKFVRAASFIIAYGENLDLKEVVPLLVVKKLESFSRQFSIFDCHQLSRGLQIALQMRLNKHTLSDIVPIFNQISSILDECTERHLQENLRLQDLNQIIRSLINRKASRKTHMFQKIMDCYANSGGYLTTRLIRDFTFNLTVTNYVLPEMCDQILQYVEDNQSYISGDTVEKILTCFYNIGYTPENVQTLQLCDEIIRRDFKFMSSLSIVQASLALCFFKSVSDDLINRIFTIEFIQQVEDEIRTCYSKEKYPERILNQVMQLNRTVCLDYPESQVPWFQQNYIEAQISKQPLVRTKFHTDMKKLLLLVVGDEMLVKSNQITPYGYRIDFVVHLNKNSEFIPPPKDDLVKKQISKVAILLQQLDSFCENKLTAMKGSELLKLRHLEILGYKVVFINLNDWNSIYMNMPGAKMNYLKNLLQIQ